MADWEILTFSSLQPLNLFEGRNKSTLGQSKYGPPSGNWLISIDREDSVHVCAAV